MVILCALSVCSQLTFYHGGATSKESLCEEIDSKHHICTVQPCGFYHCFTHLSDMKPSMCLRTRNGNARGKGINQLCCASVSIPFTSTGADCSPSAIDLTQDTSESLSPTTSSRWIKCSHYTLSSDDKAAVLSKEGWLSDSIITASQSLLLQEFPHISGLQPPILQQTSSFDVPKGEFVQILHVRSNHWCVVSNVGCDDHTVNVFDTFFDSVAEDTLRVIASIVFSSAPSLTVRMMKIGKQVNLSDCGVLSIAIAYEICTGQDPGTVIFNHRQIRQHLANCLETYKLSPFPRQVRKRQGGVK